MVTSNRLIWWHYKDPYFGHGPYHEWTDVRAKYATVLVVILPDWNFVIKFLAKVWILMSPLKNRKAIEWKMTHRRVTVKYLMRYNHFLPSHKQRFALGFPCRLSKKPYSPPLCLKLPYIACHEFTINKTSKFTSIKLHFTPADCQTQRV